MKTAIALNELESRAVAALTALLGRLSAIQIKQIDRQSPSPGRSAAILARCLVLGHSHTLACQVNPSAEPAHLHDALLQFENHRASLPGDATPVLIAPYLSPGAQALCEQHRAGFLDLQGNARLTVGEVFISMRSLPCRAAAQSSAVRRKSPARSAVASQARGGLRKDSQSHAAAALPA